MRGKISFGIRLFALMGMALGMTPALSAQAAQPAANLQPGNVESNGTYNVVIANPAAGNIEKLALLVTPQGNPKAKLVRFAVNKFDSDGNGNTVYERDEKSAPFCLTGDNGKNCNTKQAGDRWETGLRLVSTGNYEVQVEVYSDPTGEPDWTGSVPFTLVSKKVVADEPNYGTGQGNGPRVEIHDPFYKESGQDRLRVEAKVFTSDAKPMKSEDVRYVRFRVQNSNFEDVYVNHELNAPYCIFGEEGDGKTCKTLRAGDTWPQSNDINDDGSINKFDDNSIAQTTIEPGEYQLSIFVSTGQGTWSSSGNFTLLP